MVVENCEITKKREIAKGIFDIKVSCKEIAKEAICGQFIDVRCDNFTLRRPISICDIDNENGEIRLVFQIRGEGTDWLSKKEVGETLDLLGPLGNGFNVGDTLKKAAFIGGGIGVPPLFNIAKKYGKNADVIIGFRNKSAVILEEDFKNIGADLTICTDDGSYGFDGIVTKPFIDKLDDGEINVVYACGPRPMLKAISVICLQNNIPCFVSMEERMACGVGACLSCAIKINVDGEEKYLHVCKDGPVFDSTKIVW